MKKIYIKLLTEGVIVYRPVEAIEIGKGVYRIEGRDIYDPEDEVWEFPPGSRVLVTEQVMDNEVVFIATATAP